MAVTRGIRFAAMAVAATAMEPEDQKMLDAKEMVAVLTQHNLHRCMHGMVPLTWNESLAEGAVEWAHKFERVADLRTSDAKVGENLLVGKDVSGLQVVENWYAEIAHTDLGTEKAFSPQTGHYTQMIWNGSTSVGCGKGEVEGLDFWVCRYYPQGNRAHQFEKNTGPITGGPVCAKTKDEEESVRWAFGKGGPCSEAGSLKVRRRGNSLINVLGYGVEEYVVEGFKVTHSGAGFPSGSTEDAPPVYKFKVQDDSRDDTIMQVAVVTQTMSFKGRSATEDGRLVVETAEGNAEMFMGRDTGKAGLSCQDSFYFVSDDSIVSKTQVFGAPLVMGNFQVFGLPIKIPVGGPAASYMAMAACALLVSGLMAVRVARKLQSASHRALVEHQTELVE